MEKDNYLILGGCGFVGRNLVSFLLSTNSAKFIRIVDKVPPQVAWLNEDHKKDFNSEIVEFRSANLINPESCKAAFLAPEGITWDIVVNCAAETKQGQTDPVYKEGILTVSINCAQEALRHRVRRYIELSSGNMYSDEKIPHKEDGPISPWTFVAKWKKQVEEELKQLPQLPYVILRLPTVYGIGDKTGITPRILLAAVYKYLHKPMKLLWNAEMKINTVHVHDVCRAIHFVSHKEECVHQVYNVIDEANSTQGTISSILETMFNVSVEYYGNLLSSAVDLEEVANEANDIHLEPWADICRKDNVQNTPLSPHMDYEHLLKKQLHLDGTKLRRVGFVIDVPRPTPESFFEIVNDYVKMNVFPVSLTP